VIDGLSFRAYCEDDAPATAALHVLAFERLAAPLHTAAEIAAHSALSRAPDYLEDLRRSNLALAIERSGRIVGTAGWIPVTDEAATARIRKVFVHPDLARRGLGSAMVRDAEKRAASAGYSRLVVRANLNAVPLYARLGYAPMREGRMATPAGVDLPVVFMQKLPAPGAARPHRPGEHAPGP
jgi:putative acetyltransferase